MATAEYRTKYTALISLAGAADTGGGIGSWQNPHENSVIITRVVVHTTTKATAACTMDVGYTATGATTSADNLIDGVDVGTATGVFDNVTNAGSNGKAVQLVASGKYVNFSTASGAAAGLVGTAWIEYYVVA